MGNYDLIPMNEISDKAREIAVVWIEHFDSATFAIQNKHKLASDIMNYARNENEALKQQNKELADALEKAIKALLSEEWSDSDKLIINCKQALSNHKTLNQ